MKKLIASGVCFDDGLFEVVLVKTPKNAIELSNTINEAVLNKLNDKHFVTFKTSKVTFTSVNEIPWTLDGESGGKHTYVEIENCKQAIRFKLKPNDITAEQTAVQCRGYDNDRGRSPCCH